VNLGKLDHRLLLQRPAGPAPDDFNAAPAAGFEDVEEIWVQVEYPQGVEATDAAQLQTVQQVKFRSRYRTDVETTWRGVLDNKIYTFTAVAEIPRRVGLILTAVRRGQESPI
jgi:head-tail adaptor